MTDAVGEGAGHGRRIAVVVSRFPKFTETFVVNEILGLERLGWRVELLPLLAPEPPPHQPAAAPLVERARYGPVVGAGPLRALLRRARRQPGVLLGIVARLVADTWRRPRFMAKDLVLLPRICQLADDVTTLGIVHVHAHFATHAGFAAWAIGRLTGVGFSIVAHGSDVHRHQAMLPTKVAEAAFVATVSRYNREVIASLCGDRDLDHVVVSRSGIDLGSVPFTPTPDGDAARSANTTAATTVLCVGTLHEVKGQRVLIEAIARLRDAGLTVAAELVGDGPDRAGLETLARDLGIADAVDFRGALAHAEVIERMRRASVVATPSVASSDGRKEGIPTVLLEAMATGIPVVASDLAGIPELVEHERTGLLVPPGDPDALAAAIRRIVEDPAGAEVRRDAARAHVEAEYGLESTTRRIGALIDRSIG